MAASVPGHVMPPKPIVRLLFPAPLNLGPGKIRLLEAIHSSGSLSGAARALHISYRRAWDMLDAINKVFPVPVVETAAGGIKGGGARLTERGEALVRNYRELESRLSEQLQLNADELMRLLG